MKEPTGKTVITIEAIQRTTIRSRKAEDIVLCERCAAEITPTAAAHSDLDIVSIEARLLRPANDELTEER